jgi:hypothetical protein
MAQSDKELFTDLGDFVSQPTDFLSAYNPVAQQRMQEGYLADYGLEIPNIELGGQKIPMFMLGAAANAIANPEYTMTQALRQGAAPVYGTLPGQEGSILGATSPSGDIVYSNAPIGDSLAALKGTFGFGPGSTLIWKRPMRGSGNWTMPKERVTTVMIRLHLLH